MQWLQLAIQLERVIQQPKQLHENPNANKREEFDEYFGGSAAVDLMDVSSISTAITVNS